MLAIPSASAWAANKTHEAAEHFDGVRLGGWATVGTAVPLTPEMCIGDEHFCELKSDEPLQYLINAGAASQYVVPFAKVIHQRGTTPQIEVLQMFVPSYSLIATAIGITSVPSDGRVSVNVGTLRLLLQFVALAADFDKSTYLKQNPDIAAAYEAGQIEDLQSHFIESGFFEGRKAAELKFDEEWYLKTYPDVAASLKEGVISSALTHFQSRGEVELRAPDPNSLRWMGAWAEALSRS